MTFTDEQREAYMRLAMDQAELSIAVGGMPFGAVMFDVKGKHIASARNTVTPDTDILRHAELNLLRIAHQVTGAQKFPNSSVFINAASCAMCAAALIQAGIRSFYFGAAYEPHTNPAMSYMQIAEYCQESLEIHDGILQTECQAQIERGRKAKL